MRPNSSSGRHWDGSPRPPRSSLQVAAHNPSRLLRAGQTGRCRSCGNPVDWYQRTDHRTIALHPAEVATTNVPEACRWHLSGGIAHPHDDGSGWCRIPHAVLCPQPTTHPRATSPRLMLLRRQLAVRSRRLIDTSTFTPAPATMPLSADRDRAVRPVVRIILTHYLGKSPVKDIRCIAQTRQRHRCIQPILDTAHTAGRWVLLPIQPHRGQLALEDANMAVYDLNHLPYAEQQRWRSQRCTTHAATPAAVDLALADRQPFNSTLHAAHIRTQLPHPTPHHSHRR